MTDLWTYLEKTEKSIVLYGTGDGADKIYAQLQKRNIKISGVFASAGFKKGKEFANHTVTSYEELKEKLGDMIILVCFGSHLDSVIDYIEKLSRENELYLPDVPVCEGEIFNVEFAIKHKKQLEKVYSSLADEISKKVFENTVYFKLTGDFKYLKEIETQRSEVFDVLSLKGERFLDLGAFNGDTVEEFLLYDKQYKSITALEPDSRNFRKLKDNTKDIKNVTLINAAVDSSEGTVLISKNKGRGNKQSGKTVEIPCVSVDGIAVAEPFTFIKMDVEGNEAKAIEGAKKAIGQKPKMHIAAYHRSEDIFSIPIKVLEINPDYKIYMRKHRAIPAWDINYIFV
ncbi:MAG: FkbM family methyltransferase [Acutalibacteraceae bacterium]|nr:FkbM family methyltransferase [Acutalibacteraceae bacterium]